MSIWQVWFHVLFFHLHQGYLFYKRVDANHASTKHLEFTHLPDYPQSLDQLLFQAAAPPLPPDEKKNYISHTSFPYRLEMLAHRKLTAACLIRMTIILNQSVDTHQPTKTPHNKHLRRGYTTHQRPPSAAPAVLFIKPEKKSCSCSLSKSLAMLVTAPSGSEEGTSAAMCALRSCSGC